MDLFFSIFANDLAALGTYAGISALITIILIDIVMSGDNAILIGMATKNLTGELRKKAIFWGVAGATVLRIIFSLGVVYLLQIPGLEFAGALLLLYVVWKFYREIRATEHGVDTHAGPVDTTFRAAIQTIIIADVVMSLDNVLAVAGASHGNVVNLIIGLVVSIILMVVASSWIAKLLEKYPSIQWVGLFVILFTALHMLEKGFSKASMYAVGTDTIYGIPEQTIFTLLLVGIISLFAVLQTRYLRADRSAFATWAKEHGRILMITIFFLLILAIEFGAQISAYMSANHGYKYGFFMICVLGILEVLRLQEPSARTGIVDRIFGKK